MTDETLLPGAFATNEPGQGAEESTSTMLNEGQLPELNGREDLVTVGVFPDSVTAHMARGALEASGIAVFVHGENANSLLPVAFNARLQVRPEDESAARAVLDSPDFFPATDEEVTAAEIAGESNGGTFSL